MKRYYIILLIFIFLFSSMPDISKAADMQNKTLSIPTETLTGSSNTQKTIYLELPSGVSDSSIVNSSLKYNGTNQKVSLSLENGKVKLTLKGVEAKQRIDNIMGYYSSFEAVFKTNPGNSIWRYSDGKRWQINEWDPYTHSQKYTNVNGPGFEIPSNDPPSTRTIVTKSDVTRNGIKWYNGSVNAVIDPAAIIESSVQLIVPTDTLPPAYVNHNIVNGNQFVIYYKMDAVRKNYDPEQVSDSFGSGGHVLGRRYNILLNYYFTASANVTSYKYSGNVSFDYKLPTEPTLSGTVTLLAPNPNPTKLGDKDVPVQISLKGDLLGYNNSSNIEEWVFYAKEKGSSTVQTKKDIQKIFNTSKQFDFIIPKSRVTTDNFKQDYDLTVTVRFKKPIVTKTGTITSLSQVLTSSAGVYKNAPTVTFPPGPSQPTTPTGKPPVARISAPRYVKAGDDILISGGASFDPDGYITDYSWDTSGAQGEIGNNSKGYVWYTQQQIGKSFPIALTVVDNDKLIGSTSTEVTVIEPKPEANISVSGTLKQNRKVILENRSSSPTRFPLVPDKTRVTVTVISGGTNADIKYSGTLGEIGSKAMLFKKPGRYKAAIYVENTLGYSASQEITFDISPDEVPVNYFTLPGVVYRNPDNSNKAVVSLDDISYSPDKDVIARRVWEYRYDSNNNGSFSDESWVIFSNENADRLNLDLLEVGKYEIRMTVHEEFGQPTIDEFVIEADRKSTNSDGQALNERTVEVKNRAPEVDWSW